MAQNWIRLERGIRYREHPTRYHGKKLDRYFAIRFSSDHKVVEEGLGWASEGWSLAKVREKLNQLRIANRVGQGPCTLAEAREDALKLRKDKLARKKEEQSRRVSLDTFWETDFSPAQGHKKEKTVAGERDLYWHWISPAFGKMPVMDITDKELEQLKNTLLAAQKAPRTIQYIMEVFSQIWHFAERRGLVSGFCPTTKVKLPKFDNRRDRYLTEEEANLLLDTLRKSSSPTLYVTALLSLYCGLRAGEIHSLTWNDLDFENNQITLLDPKNSCNRHAYMVPPVKEALLSLPKSDNPEAYVIPSDTGGRRQQVSKEFSRTIERLGFNEGITDPRQKVVFHTLRHTFASWLVQRGQSLYTVKELMGHSTLEMTQRYAHLAPSSTRTAALSLADSFPKKMKSGKPI